MGGRAGREGRQGGAFEHRPDKPGGKAAGEARADRLRQAIKDALHDHGRDHGLTRKELWEALPAAVRKNENRFAEVLGEGVGVEWGIEQRAPKKGGPLYHPIPF